MRGRWISSACVMVLATGACQGEIGAGADEAAGPRGPGSVAGSGVGSGATAGASGAGLTPTLGEPGNPDPIAQPARFSCDDPSLRGRGQLAMRRLTRDELLDSLTALVGSEVMSADAVTRAVARIPLEPPGDIVATFQNGHALDHVEGLLLTAEAVAAEVAADATTRARVLGDCASTAAQVDRACAESFLDGPARSVLRRPLSSTRRAALLAAFDAEGGGVSGLQWLLARLLQAPEVVFHLELPRAACATSSPAASAGSSDAVFAWDDASVFFAPNGASQTGPRQQLVETGWYVWMIPGARIESDYAELRLDVGVTTDGTPVELDINLDDTPLSHDQLLSDGDHQIALPVSIVQGADVKVGVYFANAAAGRVVELRSLTLAPSAQAAAPPDPAPADCTAPTTRAGVYAVDDWTVASRLSFALTGQSPDEALLDAAARGELASVEQVMPHAERLLDTPEARRQLEHVLDAWLNLDAIPAPHPTLAAMAGIDPDGLPGEARRELLDYAVHMVFDEGADTTALMSTPVGFPRSQRMATLYGSEVAQGDTPVDLPNGHGGMLLRVAPLLSGQLGSSPILRGVYVRKRILCDTLPSPDFTIVNSRVAQFEAEDRTQLSTREAVTEITAEGACPGCHVQINPLGFSLEPFGPLGMPRSEEIVYDAAGQEIARHPIDAVVDDANVEPGAPSMLSGPADLNSVLAGSAKVRACIGQRLYTHARLRPAVPADDCALAEVEQALREGASIRDAWLRAVVDEELFVREEEAQP